jgi:hypothetical protein
MHPTLMLMFMDAQRAERERRARFGRPNASRMRPRHGRGERR